MDLQWSAADSAFRDEVRSFLDEKLTPELRTAGRLMTSVYADHEASMEWQAHPARTRLGRAGVAGRIRRLRLEPDPALHLQPGVDTGRRTVVCRRWEFAWSRTRSSPSAPTRRRSSSCPGS